MNKFTKQLFACFCLASSFLVGCKEEFDEYYARPENLEGPIYQVLSDSSRHKGNFDHYLALVEKAGYKETLSRAGYWTAFAPTDEAFEQYFQENNLSGVEDIDEDKAYEIVTYSLVYNGYSHTDLGYYQNGPGRDTLSAAFRRKTAYYRGVYKENVGGEEIDVVAANRNGFDSYNLEDNNNKYIPYFMQHYLDINDLTSEDIEYFYNRPYTGAQVAEANIVTSNIAAENGYVHSIDKVIEPMPNIADYIDDNPQYSLFKSILEMEFRDLQTNTAISYNSSAYPELTERYGPVYDLSGPVHVKAYTGNYTFSPNNENFIGGNLAQSDSWSMFVPENDALQQFLDDVLLVYYGSIENVPDQIIYDFVNMHMWQAALWPSQFQLVTNNLNEEARFDPNANITDKKILSNGIFYGTNKVQEGNFFFTVYSRPYLDPQYSIMRELLNSYRITISDPDQTYGLILMSNQQLRDAGFEYDPGARNPWTYNGEPGQAYERLIRMLEMCIIKLGSEDELDDLSTGSGILETYGGEYIRYEDGEFFASGNMESGENVQVKMDETYESTNGPAFYTEGLLTYSEKLLSEKIFEFPQFSRFAEYLENSSIYDANSLQIEGVAIGQFFTVLIPSNEAINTAVADGVLPADPQTNDPEEIEQITNFLKYHFVPRNTIVPDGKKIVSANGSDFPTLYTTVDGETKEVVIDNSADGFQEPYTMTVTDLNGNVANVNIENSNVLASYAVLHEIDRVLESN
ncbi:fasciclin domain-containing protein [Echinicola jeungdonensis]|uniref:Fasciclin domain-containing protein n=1 Tax=Echinicola jeungdonensis TaxID=709343 RepID=A0ABV5J4Y0_9BACT|nr:fasciclin domain-containing protein [Echinicola jeungdonensis]MDN3669516.1 fasciclin domain-containing protein [Echinicola jeungdonensis]